MNKIRRKQLQEASELIAKAQGMRCIAETMQEATRKHCASFRQELKCITMVITPHTTE